MLIRRRNPTSRGLIFHIQLLCLFVFLGMAFIPNPVFAERASSSTTRDIWTFYEAWRVFRFDVEASLPGEHGEALLIERLEDEPPWLLRDGLRLARSPEALSFLARRAAHRGDVKSISALRHAAEATPNEQGRRVIERALIKLGDRSTQKALASRLREGSPANRKQVAAALGAAGQKTAPILIAALDDPDVFTRIAAAATLATQENRRARKLLRKLLDSNNRFHQVEAAHALAATGDPRALRTLAEELERRGSDSRQIVRSLGIGGGDDERVLLLELWSSLQRGRSLALRSEILRSLGLITTRTTLESLRPRLEQLDEAPQDTSGTRAAWLETLGWAVVHGARTERDFALKVRQSVQSAWTGETPIAHKARRARVLPLHDALVGKAPRGPDVAQRSGASTASLLQSVRARNVSEARQRSKRFDAAVELVIRLGEQLGHEALADPSSGVAAVGLNAARATDGNLLTSWVTGDLAGPLRLDLTKSRTISTLHLIGGCVDSQSSYRAHARVRELTITIDGRPPFTATLDDDSPYFQRVSLPRVTTDRISLQVTKVYPGERESAAACIPEIRVR